MSLIETKSQLVETIRAYEDLRSQIDKDAKRNLQDLSEEDCRTHLSALGQKTVSSK
jgi:hypothetical protein